MALKNKGELSPMTLVSFAVIMILGVTIFSNIDAGISSQGCTGACLAARNNVSANTYGAWQTLSSAPVIIGAVIILGIVGIMGGRQG